MIFTADSATQKSQINQTGLLIPEGVRESLIGKMCQIIEMLGLRDTQEKATKDSVRNAIYDMLGHDGSTEYIESNLYEVINSVIWQARNDARSKGELMPDGDYCLTKTIKES
jgi:hypothetical protein